jgi:hypothetical protein
MLRRRSHKHYLTYKEQARSLIGARLLISTLITTMLCGACLLKTPKAGGGVAVVAAI